VKEKLIRKFVEKLDYSYNYKTVNERQIIINDLCKIAGIEQLNMPDVVGKSEQYCKCGFDKKGSTVPCVRPDCDNVFVK